MFSDISNRDRHDLVAPCYYWVEKLDIATRETIVHAIVDAFAAWKARQGKVHSNIDAVSEGHAQLPAQRMAVPLHASPRFDENDIELAFKLWVDDDPAFAEVLAVHDLHTVMAVIGVWSTSDAAHQSLIRLNAFLVRSLIREIERVQVERDVFLDHIQTRRRKAPDNLAAARKNSAEKRKQEAINNERDCRTAAREYATNNNPMPSKQRIVAHVLTLGISRTARFGKRTTLKASTIGRLIAGVMGEARETSRPRDELYSTDHTRND